MPKRTGLATVNLRMWNQKPITHSKATPDFSSVTRTDQLFSYVYLDILSYIHYPVCMRKG